MLAEFKEKHPGDFAAEGESYVAALARKEGPKTGPEWYYGTEDNGYYDSTYAREAEQGLSSLVGDPHRGDPFGELPAKEEEDDEET